LERHLIKLENKSRKKPTMKEIVNHTQNESKRKAMKEGSKSDILRSSRLGKD
jgi:hypothetical protein